MYALRLLAMSSSSFCSPAFIGSAPSALLISVPRAVDALTSSLNSASRLASELLAIARPRTTPTATLRNHSSVSRSLVSGAAIIWRVAPATFSRCQVPIATMTTRSARMMPKPPPRRMPMRRLLSFKGLLRDGDVDQGEPEWLARASISAFPYST